MGITLGDLNSFYEELPSLALNRARYVHPPVGKTVYVGA